MTPSLYPILVYSEGELQEKYHVTAALRPYKVLHLVSPYGVELCMKCRLRMEHIHFIQESKL